MFELLGAKLMPKIERILFLATKMACGETRWRVFLTTQRDDQRLDTRNGDGDRASCGFIDIEAETTLKEVALRCRCVFLALRVVLVAVVDANDAAATGGNGGCAAI